MRDTEMWRRGHVNATPRSKMQVVARMWREQKAEQAQAARSAEIAEVSARELAEENAVRNAARKAVGRIPRKKK